ncbi:MAG: cytochrome b [Gammaproteobacteria bacterium]|nr:cytochrome b [Gammaproteobacteria bacterium]
MFNSLERYGWVAVVLHWVSAVVVFCLFGLGIWMTGLDYYDSWYKKGPDLHRAVGVLLFISLMFRIVWRRLNVLPKPEPMLSNIQVSLAHWVHLILYVLLILIMISGYLISTADGRSVEVFNLFEIPALLMQIENQEDIAGAIHWYLALTLMFLVGLHVAASLKHHFIERNNTLLKMLGKTQRKQHQ